MKKFATLFPLAALALVSTASADCLTGSYGAGITVAYTNNKCVATFEADGDDHNNPLSLPSDKTVTVDSVHYKRTSTASGKAQTVVLPFAVSNTCSVTGATFYIFDAVPNKNKIYENADPKWVALLTNPITISGDAGVGLNSYFPYMFKFTTKNSLYFDITDCSIEFTKSESAGSYTFPAPGLNGTWELKGSLESKKWEDGNEELGTVYGFSAKKDNSIGIDYGQFVKAAAGASVPPLRAYLVFNKSASLSKTAATETASISADDLPSTIEVVFEDEDSTTAIGKLGTRTGNVTMSKDLWFDMKGRKFGKEPSTKGTYYNQGKKVIVK